MAEDNVIQFGRGSAEEIETEPSNDVPTDQNDQPGIDPVIQDAIDTLTELVSNTEGVEGVVLMMITEDMQVARNILTPKLYECDTCLSKTLGQMRMTEHLIIDEAEDFRIKKVSEI